MERYIFDLDGTLLHANWDDEDNFFREILGENAGHFNKVKLKILTEYESLYYKYDIDTLSEFFKFKGENITPEIIHEWCYFNGNVLGDKISSDAVDILEYLKSKDRKISLLTNWIGSTQINRLKRAGIREYFDTIICGDTVLKPNKDSYLFAANNTPLDKCLMIGDNIEKDYYGALSIGMNAYLVNEKNSLSKVKKIGGKRL